MLCLLHMPYLVLVLVIIYIIHILILNIYIFIYIHGNHKTLISRHGCSYYLVITGQREQTIFCITFWHSRSSDEYIYIHTYIYIYIYIYICILYAIYTYYCFICISIFNILGDHIKQFFSTFTDIKIMFV